MIQLVGVHKVVDGRSALDVDDLQVRPGEIAALVGSVDSGKDIVLALLTGQMRPTGGEIRVAELEPIVQRGELGQRIGVLFEQDGLYQRHSVLSNLRFACRLYDLPKAKAEAMLVRVGLADQARTRVERLSSSLARRLAFGRAILHEPQVLLLVDPFARCDDNAVTLLSELMRQLADAGTAILLFAGEPAGVARLCDTIYLLEQGRIVDVSRPAEEQRSQLPFKIPVRLEGRVALVNPADILYALARAGRVHLQTVEGQLPTQFSLAELEQRLAPSGFFRAHRGYLVNLQHVKEVIPYTRNSFSLVLDDPAGTEIPLSKSAAAELRELLGY